MCSLTWGALIELDGTVTVSVVVKGGRIVRVPISADMAAQLMGWRMDRGIPDPDEHVLVNQHSAPYTRTSLGQLIERIGRRAGIQRFPVRPHVLRHTLNIIRRRAKIDPTLRSQLLTHSNPSSLAAYEHVLDGELAQAREQQRQGLGQYLGDYVTRLGALPPTDPPKSLNP